MVDSISRPRPKSNGFSTRLTEQAPQTLNGEDLWFIANTYTYPDTGSSRARQSIYVLAATHVITHVRTHSLIRKTCSRVSH
jgi:hypothetical protein